MSYYFVGGEDFDFSPIGGPAVVTGGSFYRTAYARCTLNAGGSQSWRVPASYGLAVTGNFWLTARLGQTTGSPGPLWTFNGPGDAAALSFWSDGTLHKTVSGVTTQIATSTGAVPFNVLTKMDVFIDFNTSGTCLVYFDGDQIGRAHV